MLIKILSRLSSLFANLSRESAGNLLIRPAIFVIEWPLHITNYRENRYQDSSSLEKKRGEDKNREKERGKRIKRKKKIMHLPDIYIYIIQLVTFHQ